MMSFILIQIYLLGGILWSAGHDATTHRMKGPDNSFSGKRINRWHRDGFFIALCFVIPTVVDFRHLAIYKDWYWCVAAAGLLRLSVFDIAFNKWAGMVTLFYLGGTAWADQKFMKIFGKHGAGWKCLTFFILLVGLNILKYHLHL